MTRLMFAAAAIVVPMAAPACAADLDIIRAPRVHHHLRVVHHLDVVVLPRALPGPVPLIVAVPAPPPAVVVVPIPDSLFPFFEPAPPPAPSPTIFSSRIIYPVPSQRTSEMATSPENAETIHYGYTGRIAQPQLPLGYYPPYSLD